MKNRAAARRSSYEEPGSISELSRSITEFCERSEVSPATRRFYRDSLGRLLLPWAEAEGLREPRDLIPAVVERYAIDLEERRKSDGTPLSVATRATYLRAVRQYLGWLRRRRKIEEVDEREMALPGARRRHRDVLTPAELQALEDAAPIERDKLLIRVLADAGPRIGEVANLTVSDLVVREGRFFFLRFRGKTGERLTPIEPALYRRLTAYATGKAGRPMHSGHAALFMSHRRSNGTVDGVARKLRGAGYEPLGESGMARIVGDAAEVAGIGRRVHPHLFRHSRITSWVAGGMNIVTVAEIAGVSVAIIARHYVHQTDEQRYEAVMKALAR